MSSCSLQQHDMSSSRHDNCMESSNLDQIHWLAKLLLILSSPLNHLKAVRMTIINHHAKTNTDSPTSKAFFVHQ